MARPVGLPKKCGSPRTMSSHAAASTGRRSRTTMASVQCGAKRRLHRGVLEGEAVPVEHGWEYALAGQCLVREFADDDSQREPRDRGDRRPTEHVSEDAGELRVADRSRPDEVDRARDLVVREQELDRR